MLLYRYTVVALPLNYYNRCQIKCLGKNAKSFDPIGFTYFWLEKYGTQFHLECGSYYSIAIVGIRLNLANRKRTYHCSH